MEMSLKKATIYNLISKYGTMLVQLGLTMVLARLILPEAYGVISILLVLLNFLSLIADMGLGISIIQHPETTKEEQNALFSFSFFLGIGVSIVMIIASFPVSAIYRNESYKLYCPLISIAGFFNTLNIVPNAALMRDKRFDIMAMRSILSAVVPGIVAVILAFLEAGVYALIFQSICSSLFLFIWNYTKNPFKLSKFEMRKILHLMGKYSLFQLLFNILNYFTRNLDNLLIGAKLGDTQLGYYNKAYTLNLYPNTLFTNVVTGVLHPYIRDYKNDYAMLEKKIMEILKILSLSGIFMMMVCYGCAKEIIIIMFGSQWEAAIPCFKMLSICIWAQMLSSVAGSVFLGIERTDQTLKCGIINLIIIIAAIVLGLSKQSIEMLSLYVGISYNIIFLITYYILIRKTMGLSFSSFIKKFLFDILFAFSGMFLITILPDLHFGIFIRFILKIGVILAVYLIYLFITKQIIYIKEMVLKFFKN